MGDTIAVKITADVVDLQTKFALARAESSALSREINKLAQEAVAAGGATPQLSSKLQELTAQSLAAKNNMANLRREMNTGTASTINFSGVLGLAKSAMGAFGIAMSAAAVVRFGEQIFDSAEQVAHEAEVLGLTTTAMQAFQKSALLANVDIDTVDNAIRRFNASQGAAQAGTAAQADAFKDLGVSANLPAEQALPAVARALLSITNVARRSHDEVALFSKAGEELNPVLEQWAQGTDTLTAKLQDMGLILSDQTTQAARDAKKEMDLAFGQMEVAWAPAVVNLTGNIADLLEELQKIGPAAKSLDDVSAAYGTAFNKTHVGAPGGGSSAGIAHGGGDIPAGLFADSTGTPHVLSGGGAKAPPPYDPKAATQARTIADEVSKAYEQGALRRIASDERANSFSLESGQETAAQWLQIENASEDERYAVTLVGIQKREQADQGDKVKFAQDKAEEASIWQDHTDNLRDIYDQYLQKKHTDDAAALQEFITGQNEELTAAKAAYDEQLKAGQISAAEHYQLEVNFTHQVENQILQRVDAEIASLTKGTTAYEQAMRQRETIVASFNKDYQASTQQLAAEEQKAWQPAISGFHSMITGMISGNETLVQAVSRGVETMAEQWIEAELAKLEQSLFTDTTAQTSAITAQAAAGVAQVTSAAAVAAANAFASTAAIPIVGPELAPAAAAAADVAVMSFVPQASLASGTNYVPYDMAANIHKGERILPAADNRALMGAVGGGAVHVHFALSAMDTQTGVQFLNRNMPHIAKQIGTYLQNNPSARGKF